MDLDAEADQALSAVPQGEAQDICRDPVLFQPEESQHPSLETGLVGQAFPPPLPLWGQRSSRALPEPPSALRPPTPGEGEIQPLVVGKGVAQGVAGQLAVGLCSISLRVFGGDPASLLSVLGLQDVLEVVRYAGVCGKGGFDWGWGRQFRHLGGDGGL